MGNPDPWAMPGSEPVSPRLAPALAVLPGNPTRWLSDQAPHLRTLAVTTAQSYAVLYNQRLTSEDVLALRSRVSATVQYWATGRGFREAIQFENHKGDVRQAFLDGGMNGIREAVRVWCELLVVSIMAGGVVSLEEVR